jgi:hypothetical protein
MQRSRVVFPQPDGPNKVRNVLGSMVRETSLTAMTSQNFLVRFLITIVVSMFPLFTFPALFQAATAEAANNEVSDQYQKMSIKMTASACCSLPFSI